MTARVGLAYPAYRQSGPPKLLPRSIWRWQRPIAVDVLLIIYNHESGRWQLTTEMVFDDGGQIMACALAATWPIMEAMRMVPAGIFEKRIFRRGREQGREENQQLWEAWNRRRLEAEERGEAFREPPPGTEATNGRQS